MMAAAGILGEYKGSQAREVMMTLEEYERVKEQMEAEEAMEEQENGPPSSEPAYVTEGQRGYVSTDSEDN
jgi:hypothetical protein